MIVLSGLSNLKILCAQSNFWDVSSLQAALPNGQMSTPFTAGANEHWFAQEPMVSYVPAGSDGE